MNAPRDISYRWNRLRAEYPALDNWQLVINPRPKLRAGCCKWRPRIIELSEWILKSRPDAVDTLLHEAAHALAGPGAGHGPRWKLWAERLGAEPRANCGVRVARLAPRGRHRARCRSCGFVIDYHQMVNLRGRYHRPCGPGRGRLEWLPARRSRS